MHGVKDGRLGGAVIVVVGKSFQFTGVFDRLHRFADLIARWSIDFCNDKIIF
ncbi:hypothetical protein KVF10_03875 [Helicobacter pylori]|nr:hypothetical protein KVF10_03875 [Helicobacter pylori]